MFVYLYYTMKVKLRIAAINNHTRYGICKYPEFLFKDKNSFIINTTKTINIIIQINANK